MHCLVVGEPVVSQNDECAAQLRERLGTIEERSRNAKDAVHPRTQQGALLEEPMDAARAHTENLDEVGNRQPALGVGAISRECVAHAPHGARLRAPPPDDPDDEVTSVTHTPWRTLVDSCYRSCHRYANTVPPTRDRPPLASQRIAVENADEQVRRARVARFATVPIVLVGTIAVTAGLTGPVANAATRHDPEPEGHRSPAPRPSAEDITAGGPVAHATLLRSTAAPTVRTVSAIVAVPSSYVVQQGDTVTAIAERFGLAPRDVLAANGLSWNTIIHPGQQLQLRSPSAPNSAAPAPAPAAPPSRAASYRVVAGDTISGIARRLGVSSASLIAANGLPADGRILVGQTLSVPPAGTAAPTVTATAAVSTSPAPAPAREVAIAGTVTIQAGQTIASIASAHGVTVSALLAANGLAYTSTIYAGASLVIPADRYALTAEQRANAAVIVSVGRSLGVPQRGIVIALAAAMQESGLRNLAGGDRDSIGLFQQRPSQGWGSPIQLQNPRYAAALFFGGPSNPNAGVTCGLLDVPGWQSMTLTEAAQAVQVSAFPNAYGQWEQAATHWLASL